MGLFHEELFHFLEKDLALYAKEQGISLPLPSGLENLLEGREELQRALSVERGFLTAFSEKEFADCGKERYFPRIYRGLPRTYPRDNVSTYYIKNHFTHLPSLIEQSLDPLISSFYATCAIPKKMQIALLCYVMTDGLGDWAAGSKAAALLREQFPEHDIHLVAVMSAHLQGKIKSPEGVQTSWVFYDETPSLSLIPAPLLEVLKTADWMLQLPTFFTSMGDLIGEYGFLESVFFDPRSGGRAMGLHCLEKGIFIEQEVSYHRQDLENERLSRWLSGSTHHLYFAYLSSQVGGMIYLQALLQSLEKDPRGIDLCTPDLEWFFKGIQSTSLAGKFNIERLEVYWEEDVSSLSLSPSGKVVRLLCPGRLDPADVKRLIALSGPFVGVRGNQSLSEALSYGKVFFFDGRVHNRCLIKDLLALAENRTNHYEGTLTCLRMMREVLLHQLPKEEGELVDELFFHEAELSEGEIIEQIAGALQDPRTALGYQELGRIVREEHSFNEFLIHFASRRLAHRLYPELAQEETALVAQFSRGEITLTSLVNHLQARIAARFKAASI